MLGLARGQVVLGYGVRLAVARCLNTRASDGEALRLDVQIAVGTAVDSACDYVRYISPGIEHGDIRSQKAVVSAKRERHAGEVVYRLGELGPGVYRVAPVVEQHHGLALGYGMLLEVEGDDLNVNSRRNSLHAARDVNPEIP